MQVLDLLETYQVDQAHARSVADHALALFDGVAARYDLPADARRMVELSALLHNVGLTTDPPDHHLVGRDIVLRHGYDDLPAAQQAMLACTVAFHRKKVRPHQEPAFLSLTKKQRKLALKLAAIVRVADGLDYSQSGTTSVLAVEPCDHGFCLKLNGPHAANDGDRAVEKADLWQKVFGEPLTAAASEGNGEAPPRLDDDEPDVLLAPWYAAGDTPLAELGRVLLRRHFRDLMAAARKVGANRSIKPIHDLRVATRRLRAAMALLEPVAPPAARKARKALKGVANQAGAYAILMCCWMI
ncbi:MAG: CHAD domain-containing protein [Oscillochloris sp.]|nr:CHAD domain-containing protein [Oscillochloris sp.]